MSARAWSPSMLPGSYVSDTGTHTAELRRPGRYDGVKCVRHYAIRLRGGSGQIIGTAPTLAEAASMYL